ncbi:SpoIIE family protein phosphatase [Streptomyces sp. PSKA54]|uniref:protein-serine/threonine phosphatase n=1 Tax=Streptomyces himalayensis subsp. aureolus TaxID=2758039 RepID=A0A7W2D7G3_9ACTN|nr:SpoIIE family protein phosphatase [Streptomyces himalayensis]MBA4866051.1 SpoIIE family protein phosphatase [Streptomyces himalayensis subsp. aureolus]
MGSSGVERRAQPTGAQGVGGTSGRDDALVAAVIKAVEVTGAHAASAFLIARDQSSLVLTAAAGTPPSLIGGWHRVPVNSGIPVAEAYRSGRTVHLADADETVRRFPQFAVAMPYPFGSASVPVKSGRRVFGAMSVVWASRPGGEGLSQTQRRQLRAAADRLGAALAALDAHGALDGPDAATIPLVVPVPSGPAVRVGLFDWDLDTGAVTADDEMCAIFGIPPHEFDGRAATLEARLDPTDVRGFRSAARVAIEEGRVLAQHLRMRDGEGHRTVEVWGHAADVPEDRRAETRPPPRLVGAVLDSVTGLAAVAAIERLADGFFALAPDGRVSYANHGLERLLRVGQDELLGHRPWDVLPWLSDPVYEDRYRAALITQKPVSFLVRRPPDHWLVFSFHPGTQGMTGWAAPATGKPGAERLAEEGATVMEGATVTSSAPMAAPRLGSLYRVLHMGSALTEAVTAREVCRAVAEQLLPAFGGQKLAVFEVDERRLHLLWQGGYPEGFLDQFEGILLESCQPATDSLTSGTPRFIEDRQELLKNYPGFSTKAIDSSAWAFLPLIASGRPVGVCILGFNDAHRFPSEERGVLTAMGGLIAQALERARLYDAESAIARGLQDALLPHRLPRLPDMHVTGRYLPGTRGMDIGGDWYDAIPAGEGVALIVGDVEGHNVAAAALMGQLRSAVRAFATAGHRPRDVVASTNRLLLGLDSGLLASCCYVMFHPRTGLARLVRAGHCPPLLREPDGRTRALDLPCGPILGVEEAPDYPESELHLSPGSVLALYTDGLIERRGSDLGTGIEALRSSLAHAHASSLEELADRLLIDARHTPHRLDDIALLLTEYVPARAA